nr:Rpn family recombination-promoting nuclease/putative transposase [Treponema vincentii]
MYIEGFKEGEPYTSLDKSITINLISQGFNQSSEMHSAYSLLEQKTYKPLTDLMEIHFLSLSAARKFEIQKDPIEKQQKLINWLRFTGIHPFENRRCRC